MEIKKILVVRMRQMGDALLATPLLDTLRNNYPEAQIDFVLNERIASLFSGHPAISQVIAFTDEELHSPLTYIKKVWHVVRTTRYDVIIDMRSTLNTMLFALFSHRTPLRIGIRKPYTWFAFNHRFDSCKPDEGMIDHNLSLIAPLGKMPLKRAITLHITEQERTDFRKYMVRQGIDFTRPIMLAGVTAKLASKTWAEERMVEVLHRFTDTYPQVQIIFNFAPGQEAENARRIYDKLCTNSSHTTRRNAIFLNIEAKSMRHLAAMAANCTFYFGNEGGGRHVVQAVGRPSLVVCSPMASKKTWLPESDEILTRGIAATDIQPNATHLSAEEQYALIDTERVWSELQVFYETIMKKE